MQRPMQRPICRGPCRSSARTVAGGPLPGPLPAGWPSEEGGGGAESSEACRGLLSGGVRSQEMGFRVLQALELTAKDCQWRSPLGLLMADGYCETL